MEHLEIISKSIFGKHLITLYSEFRNEKQRDITETYKEIK